MAEKSHTKPWQRVAVFIIAMLFVLTSAALTIAVVVQGSGNNDKSSQPPSQTKKQLAGTKEPGFTPLKSPITQLKTADSKVGGGQTVAASDTITADYTGWLADSGVIFDASADHGGPQTFPLSAVIPGWTKAIPGMKVGGTRRLFIPASLGYGAQGSPPTIPPNSDLVFDVTVTKID